ncbi:UNVERIFIED_CONTAM: hypothetical protein RMT77_004762 [Armadillidium vulgare]
MGGELNSVEMENQYPQNKYETTNNASNPTMLLCWKGRTKRERYLMLALTTVLFVACLLAFSLASLLTGGSQIHEDQPLAQAQTQTLVEPPCVVNQQNPPPSSSSSSSSISSDVPTDVCLTQGCVKAAASIIERLNETADPCEDFFDFACGNFVKNTVIPEEKTSVTTFSIVQDELREKMRLLLEEKIKDSDTPATIMAKNLYASCMDTDGIEANGLKPIMSILKQLGGWPVLEGDSWNEGNFSWIQVNYMNRKIGFSVDYLFDFSVTTDLKNSSWRMIWLDQPALGMSREYLIKGNNDSDVKAYLKYSVDVAVLMGAPKERAVKDMFDVLQFQMEIANISLPREERRNVTKLYNILNLGEMKNLTKDIDWVEYFNTLLPYGIQVDESERIGVSDPNYFRNLKKLLDKTPKRVVANYLLWRVAAASASYLSEDIRKLQLQYSKKLTGKSVNPPRWKECMGIVSSKLSYAIGNLYSKNFFNEKAKAQAVELVTYVREEFNRILKSIDWMDEKTRKQALQKADAIRPHIAYPQELLQDEKLTEYYRNLTVDNKTLLDNMRRIGIFGTSYSFSKLREMVDKLDWKRHASVAVVNAYYSSIENSIKFPAGILQGVFFEPDRPNYMNFGGIGFVIGHEITHGFDDQGKQFDAVGNLKNWWERETEERFLAKAKCIIYQYGNYTAPENGLSLNGINTQGENIADNGGIKEAYKAYHKWAEDNGKEKRLPGLKYTTDQLFWISAGQVWCSKYRPESLKVRILTGVHSPGRFRVVGSFSNSEEFSTAWNCPVGSKMNPQKKCSVWGGKITQRTPDVQKKGITEPSINKEEIEQPIENEKAEAPINNEEAEAPINNEEGEPPVDKEEEAEPPINNEETEPPINNEEEAEPPINNEEAEPQINEKEEEAETPINNEETEPPINNEEAEPPINNEETEPPINNEEEAEPPVNNEETEPPINNEEAEPPINNEETEPPINNEEEAEPPVNNEETEPPINNEEAEPPINNEETEPPINNEEEAEPPVNNEETEPPINNEEEAEPPVNNEEAEPSINNEKEEIEDDKKLLINKSL